MNGYENSKVPILFKLLKERGISAKKISEATGIPQSTITDWKNGRTVPTVDKFFAIANYLEVSADYLLGRTEYITNQINNTGTNNGTQANIINESSENNSPLDETAMQVAEMFQGLDIMSKSKVLNYLVEMQAK